jgi:dipeptidase E
VAFGGGGFSRFGRYSKLDDYVLSLSQKDHPRVLFLGTAGGDADSHIVLFYEAFTGRARPTHLKLFGAPSRTEWRPVIRDQDVIYVGGGNTANMLAIWRVHGMDQALREAWDDGVVLCGVSAGMNCWFECSITDSFGLELAALRDGLAFLPGSVCPRYDAEERRRPVYRGGHGGRGPARLPGRDGGRPGQRERGADAIARQRPCDRRSSVTNTTAATSTTNATVAIATAICGDTSLLFVLAARTGAGDGLGDGGTGVAPVKTRWPSPWAFVAMVMSGCTVQVAAQRTSMRVAPPSVADSRSPSLTPRPLSASAVSASRLSLPGCGLPFVSRSEK